MSLLMDALRKAEESKQRNASQSADLPIQAPDNQPLADHVDAIEPAAQTVDKTEDIAFDDAEYSIDVQQYSHVQSPEDCLKAQQWSMLFDKPVLNKTAWISSSDLDEEAKTLIEWDDRLAETLLPQPSPVDDNAVSPPVADEAAAPAVHETPVLDLSGLADEDSDTTAAEEGLALDSDKSDKTAVLSPAHDSHSDHELLTHLEDVEDAETLSLDDTDDKALHEMPRWEKSLLEEAESLSGNEETMLALENDLADIDPNELDWALEADALDKHEATATTQAEPEVDWSTVSIEAVENTEHHTSLDDFTEVVETCDTRDTAEVDAAPDDREPELPTLELELPDAETTSDAKMADVPSLDLDLPAAEVSTQSAHDNHSEPVPTLDLDLGLSEATPAETAPTASSPTETANTANVDSGLDWGDMLAEDAQATSAQPLRRAWDTVDAADHVEAKPTRQGLDLNWDDDLLPLPENATATTQTEAQKQQAAQDLLKAAKRRQRHTAKFNAYALVGLGSIAVLGLVLLYTLEQDPSESPTNKTGNQSAQLSAIDPNGLPSPKIEIEPDTTKPAKPPIEKQETTLPAPDSDVVIADKPKTPEKTTDNSDNTAEKVIDKIANKFITLPEKITGKITEPLGGNTPDTKPPVGSSGRNNTAIVPPKPNAPIVVEKVPSYPNTSLRQNLPPEPTVTVQKSRGDEDQVAVQRNAQRAQRTQQLNANLNQAYQAFQNRQWSQAQRLYQTVLQQDAYNRDALLGLASIALAHSNPVQAQQYYKTVLKHHPQDQTARLGLLSTTANAQPAQGERELRSLLNESSVDKGYVYFSLGNLYISQHRWSAAQQAFFDAWRQDKQQPNYAYNLAVSLEHLNQPAAAIQYYQQALQLAQRNPNQPPNFNLQTVQQRVQTLAAHLPSQQGNLTQILGQ